MPSARVRKVDSKMFLKEEFSEGVLDVIVQLNALLPCVVVYWTLAVVESAWLAVAMYEAVCLVGLPLLTLSLRSREVSRITVTRMRPLIHSLIKPQNLPRCALVTTGSLCFFGLGGFAAYLAACQHEFDKLGIPAAIREHSGETGLKVGSPASAAALATLGVWFCTVNPVLEELYWRGYCYAEVGRILAKLGIRPSPDASPKNEMRLSLLQSTEQSALSRWLVSAYFASFHAVVIAIFVNWWAAVAAFMVLAITSRIWIYLGERPPFGFPFVVAFHAGTDVAVVLVFTALDFGWATKRAAFAAALTASLAIAIVGALLLTFAWRHEPDICFLSRRPLFDEHDLALQSTTVPLVYVPEDMPNSSPTTSVHAQPSVGKEGVYSGRNPLTP